MEELVAKKYVKALVQTNRDIKFLKHITEDLNVIALAFDNSKFSSIISSVEVKSDKKVELVLSFFKKPKKSVTNLVKLLALKKRLKILPDIVAELKKEIAIKENSYSGIIYTNNELSKQYIANMEKQFSKKFNIRLKLVQNICDYDGIKVDIEDLGVEIGFSKERLKAQMIEHILKAV